MARNWSTINFAVVVICGIVAFGIPAVSANLAMRVFGLNSLQVFTDRMEVVWVAATVILLLAFFSHLRKVARSSMNPKNKKK